jgi:hypothetical protein
MPHDFRPALGTGVCRPAATPAGIGAVVEGEDASVPSTPREFERRVVEVAWVGRTLSDELDEDEALDGGVLDGGVLDGGVLDGGVLEPVVSGLQPLFQMSCPAAVQFSERVFPW